MHLNKSLEHELSKFMHLNKSLEHELKEKEGIIDYLSSSWSNGLSGNYTEVKELYHIINTNFTGGSMPKKQ